MSIKNEIKSEQKTVRLELRAESTLEKELFNYRGETWFFISILGNSHAETSRNQPALKITIS